MFKQVTKASKAWKQLTLKEQKKYNDKVKQSRKEGMKKKRKKKVAFSTVAQFDNFRVAELAWTTDGFDRIKQTKGLSDPNDHDGHESDQQDDDGDGSDQEDDDRHDSNEGDDKGDDDGDDSDKGKEIGVEVEGVEKGNMDSPLPLSPMDRGFQLRRSRRKMKSAINSLWLLTKPIKRRKRTVDDKDRFFDIISRMCSSKEGNK
ncbi:late secretory pathway protein AVL9-like [Neltuma alba]|uniref:late secretory pathway protein AVL9-like n=1 Tax=Neltuma alba TaxID=207710 RepID=UPI0010A48F09|nr:late secretory pathway protein AVL9-like [Prosopis alba]